MGGGVFYPEEVPVFPPTLTQKVTILVKNLEHCRCRFLKDMSFLISVFPAVGGVTGPIDEDLFEDEDLDELEEDLTNLDM